MTKYYTSSGTLIADADYVRRVENTRNSDIYIEFEEDDIIKDNIHLKMNRPPNRSVFYIWWVSNDASQIKINEQSRTVNYADYKIGRWYIYEGDLIEER